MMTLFGIPPFLGLGLLPPQLVIHHHVVYLESLLMVVFQTGTLVWLTQRNLL